MIFLPSYFILYLGFLLSFFLVCNFGSTFKNMYYFKKSVTLIVFTSMNFFIYEILVPSTFFLSSWFPSLFFVLLCSLLRLQISLSPLPKFAVLCLLSYTLLLLSYILILVLNSFPFPDLNNFPLKYFSCRVFTFNVKVYNLILNFTSFG